MKETVLAWCASASPVLGWIGVAVVVLVVIAAAVAAMAAVLGRDGA